MVGDTKRALAESAGSEVRSLHHFGVRELKFATLSDSLIGLVGFLPSFFGCNCCCDVFLCCVA